MDEQEKSEYEKMKAEIGQISSEYQNAKKLLQDVISLSEHFTKLRALLDNDENGVQKNYGVIKSKKDEIDGFTTQAQQSVKDISANLSTVKSNIESMLAAYSEFTEARGKITGISGEITTLLSTSKSLQEDISATKKNALELLEKIKTTFDAVSANIKEIQTAYQNFLVIRGKIDDKSTGLQAVLDNVQVINKNSNLLFSEIQSFRDGSKTFLSDIEQNKKQADELKAEIQKNFDYTQVKKGEIEKATGLIIDTSFAETFKRRQDEIETGLYSWYSWKNIFLGSVLLLITLVVLPFTSWVDFGDMPWYELFLSRLYYTSPVLFLLTFSAIQYSKERDLSEKYAFKAASSAAIRSHIDYLIENFVEEKSKVLDFTTETFSTIYKEPYTTHDGLEKRIKELEKKQSVESINSKIDVGEMVKNVKELKELLPDTSVFEKVLDFFTKK
jgi:chromosome segregation ATPase